ncbi:sulfite exporter TauE/SafE family protein [Myxococcota bacterium]|nr:sulfite exporter TauE/SafE family protein [Myxococcota bacterium]MBU1496535.1 sulfite exporter TauE/SafE family protein [Myxococcota bacterium]
MLTILLFVAIGVCGGLISGLLGIGGATLMIPALIFFVGYDQKLAQGTTLMLMVPPIGLLAAVEYYRHGFVNMRGAIIMAIFFFIGGYFGAKMAVKMNPVLLRKLFAVFLAIISVRMFFK